MSWLGRLFRRDTLERDLDKELRFHIDARVETLVGQGVAPGEARRRALAEFGGVEPIKEGARDARGTRWVEDLAGDVRYALRMMQRSPGFAAAAVLSLGLGIGANAAIFSVTEAVVLRELPVRKPSELFLINRTGFEEENLRFSWPLYQRLAGVVPGRALAAMTPVAQMQTVSGDGAARLVMGQLVSGNWFAMLGVGPAAGRVFDEADNVTPGGHPVAVISEAYWAREFANAPDVVGRVVRVNGLPMTIVGVAARGFRGASVGAPVDVWLPVMMQDPLRYRGNASAENADDTKPWVTQTGISWLTLLGRADRASTARVAAALEGAFRQDLEQAAAAIKSPERREFVLRQHVELTPGARGLSDTREQFSTALAVLMATVALVLLVACANLANLLMARSAARGQEFAVRLSLGARRGRLVRQLLTESVLLALVGGAFGVAFARWGGFALLRLASTGPNPVPIDLPLDWRLMIFAAAISLVTGVLFGILPAFRVARTDPYDALRTAGRVVGARGPKGGLPFGRALVVAQVAVSLILLVAGMLFVRTFQNLIAVKPGFDRDQLVAARFDPVLAGYQPAQLPELTARLLDRAGRIDGAEGVALAMTGITSGSARTSGVQIQGRARQGGADDVVREDYVTDGYFAAIGMRLLRGRAFNDGDRPGTVVAAVVNAAMVRRYFDGGDPIGRHFDTGSGKFEIEVVGVVDDIKVDGPRRETPAMVYYPIAQHPDEAPRILYVRVAGDPVRVEQALRRAVAAADPNLALRDVSTLRALTERTVGSERLVSRLTSVFGVLTVIVACVGLYGMVSYSVARRQREIGVRLALGASAPGIRWLVLRETLQLVAIGAVVGLAALWPLLGLLRSFVFGFSPRDPATIAAATLVIVTVGLIAGAVPAWRASRVNPTTALRAD